MGTGRKISIVSLCSYTPQRTILDHFLRFPMAIWYPTHPFLMDLIHQFWVIISNVLCVGLLAGWRYPESHASGCWALVFPDERSGNSLLLERSVPPTGVSESRAVRLAKTPVAEMPRQMLPCLENYLAHNLGPHCHHLSLPGEVSC